MKNSPDSYILALNGGSSSFKFSLYHSATLDLEFSGSVSHIAAGHGLLEIKDSNYNLVLSHQNGYGDLKDAAKAVADWIKHTIGHHHHIKAIGHRLVQGGPEHRDPEVIAEGLLFDLHALIYLAPNHLPDEIKIIRIFQEAFPNTPQVACFDTSFHQEMPAVAKFCPLPAQYKEQGLIRYGFHGLSYEYIYQHLSKIDHRAKQKKIIIAHLGNGASLAAIKDGISIDTTMGLSPIGGLVMGTRSGDLDPGVFFFLSKRSGLSVSEIDDVLSKQSGLKAIAGTGDVQELLKSQHKDHKAREALNVFCYHIKKSIGALAAAMGGLDMLVFTGGIGENSTEIRELVCLDLVFLGIKIKKGFRQNKEEIISYKKSKVSVHVIRTNEELMIARLVCKVLNYTITQ